MQEKEVLRILAHIGAVITDSHIVYTSGKHGTAYVNKDAIYPHTGPTSELCWAIAEYYNGFPHARFIDAVIAPAIGGVILSQWTAYHLTELTGREVLGVYAEKEGKVQTSASYGPLSPRFEDAFVIKRGYDKLIRKRNVLVVEDVLTTGGSVKKVVQAVRDVGGRVVEVAALCNRGNVAAEAIGAPGLFALANVKLDAWDEKECPMCKQGVPINTDIGKGREFLARIRGG